MAIRATERYKDYARHRQAISAEGSDSAKAQALLAAKAAMVVGGPTAASYSTEITPPPDMHALGAYSNATFKFVDAAADPAVTENVEVRDVSLAYLDTSTDDSSIDVTAADVAAFAAAWIAAMPGRGNFTLVSAKYLNN